MIRGRVSRFRPERGGAAVLALAAAAALLACGVKAPPRPPERTAVEGSRPDLRPPAPDGGPPGDSAPPDGGAGR